MSKYQNALNNIAEIIKVLGLNKYKKDIKTLQELILKHQDYESEAREKAALMLQDTMLYGDSYYQIEDWLIGCLEGHVSELPELMESEYLKCALRVEFRDMGDSVNAELTDEEIENMVDLALDHFSESVLNMEFLEDTFKRGMVERMMNKCNQKLC